jgi:hypothetical protein
MRRLTLAVASIVAASLVGLGQQRGAQPVPGTVRDARTAMEGRIASPFERDTRVVRADTGEELTNVRVVRKPLEIPNAFDKPCKPRTEITASAAAARGRGQRGGNLPPTTTAEDEANRQLMELLRWRLLEFMGVETLPAERVNLMRIPQELIDASSIVTPLSARDGARGDLVALREGFIAAPWAPANVMLPAPTISGRIVDGDGNPVVAAVVQLYEVRYRPLGRVMKWVKSTLTNDLGEYRLPWVPYGWYAIAAGQSDYLKQSWMESLKFTPNLPDPDFGLPLTFFPGVDSAPDAELIHLKMPRADDPAIPAPVVSLVLKERPRYNVKVRLVTDPEPLPPNTNLVVVPAGGDICAAMDYAIKDNNDGTFEIRNLPRGRYEIVAIRGRDVVSPLLPIKVEKDIDDLFLPLTPPTNVRGTIIFDGLRSGIDPNLLLGEIRVNLTRSRGEVSQVATAIADPRTFNFSIPGVGPGFYYPTVDLPPGAFVKDIQVRRFNRPLTAVENWKCDAYPNGLYSYLDGHGHLEALEVPKALVTQDPNEPLCLRIEISFRGELAGRTLTWTPTVPTQGLPRSLGPGMAVLSPASFWRKSGDNGITPPDRVVVVDAPGRFVFTGFAPGDYRLYAVEYPNAELIYRPEYDSWFGTTALSLRYEEGASPCPISALTRNAPAAMGQCEVIAPAQSTVDRIVR